MKQSERKRERKKEREEGRKKEERKEGRKKERKKERKRKEGSQNHRSANRDFPGGPVVKNPPANAGDMGSSPGRGRSDMPRGN